jgi:hypothetical protein
VPEEIIKQFLAAVPDVIELKRQVKESYIRLRYEHGYIKQALIPEQNTYKELCNQLKNVKKSLKTEIDDVYWKDYFYQVYNVMIKRQLHRHLDTADNDDSEEPEPLVKH